MVNIAPTKQTLGQHLDAVLTAAGHDVTLASTSAEGYITQAWAWLKSEWHNLGTFVSVGYMALKASGKL